MLSVASFKYALRTTSVTEMQNLARLLAAALQPGDIVALIGNLASGKTTFTQGLTTYFEIEEYASSPTFTYINEYHTAELTLLHIDAYRLHSGAELVDMGFWDYLEQGAIAIIEWADIVADILPDDAIRITLSAVAETPSDRQIEISSPRELNLY